MSMQQNFHSAHRHPPENVIPESSPAPGRRSKAVEPHNPAVARHLAPNSSSAEDSTFGSANVSDNAIVDEISSAPTDMISVPAHEELEDKPVSLSGRASAHSSRIVQNTEVSGSEIVSHAEESVEISSPDDSDWKDLRTVIEKLNKTHKSEHSGVPVALERFLLGVPEASWSTYNLKVPTFAGDVRDGHPHSSLAWIFTIPELRLKNTQQPFHFGGQHSLRKSRPTTCLVVKAKLKLTRNHLLFDFYGMGAWMQDPLPPKSSDPADCFPNVNQQEGVMFILNCLDPYLHPGQANEFFNGFDLVLGSLLERCPDDIVVQGLRNALAQIEQLFYRSRFGHLPHASHQRSTFRLTSKSIQLTSSGTTIKSSTCGSSTNQKSASTHSSNVLPPEAGFESLNSLCRDSSGTNEGDARMPNGHKISLERYGPRKKRQNINQLLACPIRKDCEVHDRPLPCKFDGAATMSYVTQHLRSRPHRETLPFLMLCRVCWEYTTSPEKYEDFHKHGGCKQSVQPRGSRVAGHWESLYTTMFPESLRIPSPYANDQRWKAKPTSRSSNLAEESTFEHYEDTVSDLTPMPPFLGDAPSLPSLDHTGLDICSQSATGMTAERAAFEMFSSFLRQNLASHPRRRLLQQTPHLRQWEIDAFADSLHTQTNDLIRWLRGASATGGQDLNFFSGPFIEANALNPGSVVFGNDLLHQFHTSQETSQRADDVNMLFPGQSEFQNRGIGTYTGRDAEDSSTMVEPLHETDKDILDSQNDALWQSYLDDMPSIDQISSTIFI